MNPKFLRVGLLIAAASFASGRAVADVPTTPVAAVPASTPQAANVPTQRPIASSQSTELQDLQSQIPLLQARATIAELQARIAKANADGARGVLPPSMQSMPLAVPPGGLVTTSAPSPAPRPPRSETAAEGMSVVAITGFDGVFSAVIRVDGIDQQAVPGAPIPGGWTVKAVSRETVTLVKGKQTVELRG